MEKKATLHFFCGKMASGKSTLASEIAKKHNAILLSEDNWLETLYPGEITNIHEYLKYSSRVKNVIEAHVHELLLNGVTVVLDYPGNTKGQRKWLRAIADRASVDHILHYLDVSDEVCKLQLKIRSQNKSAGTPFTSIEEFEEITRYFQIPSESENINIEKHE